MQYLCYIQCNYNFHIPTDSPQAFPLVPTDSITWDS